MSNTNHEKIKLTKSRHNNIRLPKINWGGGRLNKHESFVAFAAKFCRLNCLTPKQFREFWKTSINIFDNDQQEKRVCLIARILNEPKSVVRTVFENRPLDTSWNSMDSRACHYRYNSISYCCECLDDGFHGNFHESDWLRKCPIHYIDLTRELLKYSSNLKVDRYLLQLLSLLDLKCPGWEFSDSKYSLKIDIKKQKILNEFLNWRREAEKSVTKRPYWCLGSFGSNYYSFDFKPNGKVYNHNLLMKKLGWMTPIPEKLYGLFDESPLYSELDIQYFSKKLANELQALFLTHRWYELFDLYKSVYLVKGELRTFQRMVEIAINDINLAHPLHSCDCIWGISKIGGLINCLPGELKYYGNYQCPYEIASNQLYDRWLNLFPNNDSELCRKWGYYDSLVDNAKNNGIASVVGYACEGQKPILEFNWSNELTVLFDNILEKVVLAEICELKTWVASIKSGIPPDFRQLFLRNIYLVKRHNTDLQLISWPPSGNNRYERY